MEEQVFMSDGGVTVTSSHIDVNGQTFATRNVGSVKLEGGGFSIIGAVILVFGLAGCASGSYIVGACCIAVGAIWNYQKVRSRTLKLVAGGGEVVALKTTNTGFAEKVRQAIAAAISVR